MAPSTHTKLILVVDKFIYFQFMINVLQKQFLSKFTGLLSKETAEIIDFLRTENQILRSKLGGRLFLTEYDRQLLVKNGLPIKHRLHEFISIVKPEILLAWNRKMKKEKWAYNNTPKGPGRPKKGIETEAIIIKLATENNWGYGRIQGEMKKLGYHISASYIRDVLKRKGIPPSGQRKRISWKQFILSHMDVMWASDFFTEEVWTKAGLVTCYVLFFIHLGTRRIHVAGCTPNPKYAWVSQQARNFSMLLDDKPEDRCKYIIHDRDSCFLALNAVLSVEDIEIVKTPPQKPMCNAFAERFIREAREILDNMILFGESHLYHVCKKIEKYHNRYRPHQGLGNIIPLNFDYPALPTSLKDIQCKETLGGLLNHYYVEKKAA